MNKSVLLSVGLIALSLALVSAQLERCHTTLLPPAHFLNLTKFSGVWYPLVVATARVDHVEPLNITCAAVNVSLTGDIHQIQITETYTILANGTAVGSASTESNVRWDDFEGRPIHPAIWNVYTPETGSSNETVHSQAVIVSVDESQWVVQYTCAAVNGGLLERVLLWSRQRTLNAKVQETLETVAANLAFIPRSNFQYVEQSQCS